MEYWWQTSQRDHPEADAVQSLIDSCPTWPGLRTSWTGLPGKWLWTWQSRPDDCSTALGLATTPIWEEVESMLDDDPAQHKVASAFLMA